MDQTIRALRVSEKIADGLSIPLLKSILTVALHVAEAAEVCILLRSITISSSDPMSHRRRDSPENDASS